MLRRVLAGLLFVGALATPVLTFPAAGATQPCDIAHHRWPSTCAGWVRATLANEQAARDLIHRVRSENNAANAGNCYAVMSVAARYFPPEALPNVGRAIKHESSPSFPAHCNPQAQNPNGVDSGLMQIRNYDPSSGVVMHAGRYAHYLWCGGPYDPHWGDAVCNLQVGAEMYRESGWRPWVGAL